MKIDKVALAITLAFAAVPVIFLLAVTPAHGAEVAKLEVVVPSKLLQTKEEVKAEEKAKKEAEYFQKKREYIERMRAANKPQAAKEPAKEEAKKK
jgi:hypothetical protein